MSNNKRDLTRIEDLGEYIHELNQNDEETSSQESDFQENTEFTSDQENEESQLGSESDAFTSNEESSTNDFGSSFENDPFQDSNQDLGSFESGETFEMGNTERIDFPADEPPSFESLETTEILTESPTSFESHEDESFQEESTVVETFVPQESFHSAENFDDIKKFAENSNFSGMATEGNPSFSLLIKQVRYIEDVNDIIILMKELNLLQDSEEQVKARLSRGTLLIPRISEFAAIFLAHKLRRLDIDIQVGPSDEIHPPKYQDDAEIGLVSKHNLYQNQTHHFHFTDQKLDLNKIIVSAIPQLEGYQVVRYIGVASEHKVLESKIVENEDSTEVPIHYSDLAQRLKAHALKSNANAVVGINYQLTPIPSELGLSGHKYRLTCTGNLVWVQKL